MTTTTIMEPPPHPPSPPPQCDQNPRPHPLSPPLPSPSSHLPNRKRPRHDSAPESPPRSAAWAEMFLPLTLHVVPRGVVEVALPPTSTPSTYSQAINRVWTLGSHLTPSMCSSLMSLLSALRTHLSPSHPLIHRVASADTSDDTLRNWANCVDRGLHSFAARGGRQVPTPLTLQGDEAPPSPAPKRAKTTSSGRSQKVHRDCSERDNRTCILSRKKYTGVVAHIVPFSVRDGRGVDFWKFVALFWGEEETEALKSAALGTAHVADTLRNVLWLSDDAQRYFGQGWLAIIPQLRDDQFPYDPNMSSEYSALVEFPFGTQKATLAVLLPGEDESVPQFKALQPGDPIRFTTADPTRLPLPHPLLFQLHAIISRIMAMRAAAGYPVLVDDEDWDWDEYLLEEGEGDGEEEKNSNHADNGSVDLAWLHGVQQWLCPLPPPSPPCRKRRREGDQSGDEQSRMVDVVKGEYNQRMEDMRRMMDERLGHRVGEGYPLGEGCSQ